ncbi:acetoacetate decarboxylase family protein [Nocardia sp. bgisy134]|uniref:acetoacetate decarboxylase family protein n=1 Tax=Nocardia sp. bgisy134 TaxID=3413789 RepID=UPI003D737EEC
MPENAGEPTTSAHTVLGRPVPMPVRIRRARAFMASYRVPAGVAQEVIAYSGLRVIQLPRDRALCTLVFVEYVDGDLGPYHEFGVAFMVRHHTAAEVGGLADLRALSGGTAGVFIHRLPVDGEFTLAAGRGIWGFPKELADFEVEHEGARRGVLRMDGKLVVDLTVRPGLRTPSRRGAGGAYDAYAHIDGVTRRTPWRMEQSGMRARVGGAELILGDHPLAAELAALELPTRTPLTSTVDRLAMIFHDAAPV